jgi:WD40 repeat protein
MRSSLRGRWVLRGILLAVLLGAGGPHGLRGQEGQAARLDRYGDPLPEGALARLGTLRLVHLGGLSSVAVSPDGKVVASGVRGGKAINLGKKIVNLGEGLAFTQGDRVIQATVRLWDAGTGKLIREIVTPDAPVSCLLFGPGGHSLFAGCGRYVCCWDVRTGKELWQQEAIKDGGFASGLHVEAVLLARDRLMSIHDGRLGCVLQQGEGGTSFYYHPQKTVRFWERKTGKPLPLPEALGSSLRGGSRIPKLFHELAVGSDGRYAAVLVSQAKPNPRGGKVPLDEWTYTDRRLEIINMGTGNVTLTVPDAKGVFKHLTFAEDGDRLALVAGTELWILHPASGHRKVLAKDLPPWVFGLAFVGEGKEIQAEVAGASVRVWDVAKGKQIEKRPVWQAKSEHATGGRVTATIYINAIHLAESDSGKPLHAIDGHRWAPWVRFAVHSRDTLVSSDSAKAYLWDTRSWKGTDRVVFPRRKSRSGWVDMGTTAGMDRGVSVEKRLYVKEDDERLELREIGSNRLVRRLGDDAERGGWVCFSAAGNRLVRYEDGLASIFDVESGMRLWAVPRSKGIWLGYNCPPVLSPKGTFFAKNPRHAEIHLFEVNSGKRLRGFVRQAEGDDGKRGSILGFHFSADEQVIAGEFHEEVRAASGRSEKVGVMLWDVNSGKVIQEIVLWPEVYVFWREALNAPQLAAMTISNDRRSLALSGKGSKTVEIWDIASGTKRGELAGHVGPVVDLAFSPDDRLLASGSEDTTVLVWDLNQPLQPAKFQQRLGEEELALHWRTLSERDAKQADTAIWSLLHAAKDSVPFLKKRLRPVTHSDTAHVRVLLDTLDSKDFKARSRAEAELARHGELVLAELEAAAKQRNSLEKQRRLDGLLRKAHEAARPFGTPDRIRQWRVVEVLERIATREARALLRDLAGGAPAAQLTVTARAALGRLESLPAASTRK